MKVYHLGKSVHFIDGLPWSTSYHDYNNEEALTSLAQTNHQYKYLVAVTANKRQQKARKILQENGFKEVITFQSFHGGGQTLTLWIKINEFAPETLIKGEYPRIYNCSLNFSRVQRKQCNLTVKKPKLSMLSGWKNVEGTPLYYRSGCIIKNRPKVSLAEKIKKFFA